MNPRTASILAVVVLVVAIVALYLRHELLGTNALAVGLQVAAAALMLWARVTFGRRSFHAAANPTAGGLVTWGPYRYWRHPIYSAILLFVWSGVLSHGLEPIALALAAVATATTMVRVMSEERLLRAEFSGNDGYDAYARRTKRFIPFVF
jgi:protein-S-isoprenylcysteine O-methyltransferase Ste14